MVYNNSAYAPNSRTSKYLGNNLIKLQREKSTIKIGDFHIPPWVNR